MPQCLRPTLIHGAGGLEVEAVKPMSDKKTDRNPVSEFKTRRASFDWPFHSTYIMK